MFSKFINKGYQAQSCELCNTQFNILKLQRIHKCKRCQKYVCFKCGNQKQKILDEEDKWTQQGHRVCIDCWTELNKMYDLIDQNKIEWNKNSTFAIQWIKNMNQVRQKDYQYEHFLKLFYTNIKNFQDQNQIIEKDVIKGRTDYSVFNYSLKQFFYIVQQTQNKAMIRKNIANVLYAIAARYDQIGYVQGMSNVAALLLCFSDQKGAFTLFCDMIENIYPPKFFVRGTYGVNLMGLLAQIHFLKKFFLHWVQTIKMPLISHDRQPYSQEQISQMLIVLQLSASKALLSMFTGFLAFSHIHFIWNQLKNKRSFIVVEKAFIAAMYLARQSLAQRKSFKYLQKLYENLSLQQFVETYHEIQIDEKFKKQALQEYYNGLSKKWSENTQYNLRNLHKFTNFSQQQMKMLQQYFLKDKPHDFSISKQNFLMLVQFFYEILKQQLSQQDAILQITPHFVSKIYDSYSHTHQATLDFRQFICCLSVCTKSKLKQRFCAIINTYQDKNKHINRISFEKLIKNLCYLSPKQIHDKKQQFLERMNRYFKNSDIISISQLHILLNDDFINQLAAYVKYDVPGIITMMIKKYDSYRK